MKEDREGFKAFALDAYTPTMGVRKDNYLNLPPSVTIYVGGSGISVVGATKLEELRRAIDFALSAP